MGIEGGYFHRVFENWAIKKEAIDIQKAGDPVRIFAKGIALFAAAKEEWGATRKSAPITKAVSARMVPRLASEEQVREIRELKNRLDRFISLGMTHEQKRDIRSRTEELLKEVDDPKARTVLYGMLNRVAAMKDQDIEEILPLLREQVKRDLTEAERKQLYHVIDDLIATYKHGFSIITGQLRDLRKALSEKEVLPERQKASLSNAEDWKTLLSSPSIPHADIRKYRQQFERFVEYVQRDTEDTNELLPEITAQEIDEIRTLFEMRIPEMPGDSYGEWKGYLSSTELFPEEIRILRSQFESYVSRAANSENTGLVIENITEKEIADIRALLKQLETNGAVFDELEAILEEVMSTPPRNSEEKEAVMGRCKLLYQELIKPTPSDGEAPRALFLAVYKKIQEIKNELEETSDRQDWSALKKDNVAKPFDEVPDVPDEISAQELQSCAPYQPDPSFRTISAKSVVLHKGDPVLVPVDGQDYLAIVESEPKNGIVVVRFDGENAFSKKIQLSELKVPIAPLHVEVPDDSRRVSVEISREALGVSDKFSQGEIASLPSYQRSSLMIAIPVEESELRDDALVIVRIGEESYEGFTEGVPENGIVTVRFETDGEDIVKRVPISTLSVLRPSGESLGPPPLRTSGIFSVQVSEELAPVPHKDLIDVAAEVEVVAAPWVRRTPAPAKVRSAIMGEHRAFDEFCTAALSKEKASTEEIIELKKKIREFEKIVYNDETAEVFDLLYKLVASLENQGTSVPLATFQGMKVGDPLYISQDGVDQRLVYIAKRGVQATIGKEYAILSWDPEGKQIVEDAEGVAKFLANHVHTPLDQVREGDLVATKSGTSVFITRIERDKIYGFSGGNIVGPLSFDSIQSVEKGARLDEAFQTLDTSEDLHRIVEDLVLYDDGTGFKEYLYSGVTRVGDELRAKLKRKEGEPSILVPFDKIKAVLAPQRVEPQTFEDTTTLRDALRKIGKNQKLVLEENGTLVVKNRGQKGRIQRMFGQVGKNAPEVIAALQEKIQGDFDRGANVTDWIVISNKLKGNSWFSNAFQQTPLHLGELYQQASKVRIEQSRNLLRSGEDLTPTAIGKELEFLGQAIENYATLEGVKYQKEELLILQGLVFQYLEALQTRDDVTFREIAIAKKTLRHVGFSIVDLDARIINQKIEKLAQLAKEIQEGTTKEFLYGLEYFLGEKDWNSCVEIAQVIASRENATQGEIAKAIALAEQVPIGQGGQSRESTLLLLKQRMVQFLLDDPFSEDKFNRLSKEYADPKLVDMMDEDTLGRLEEFLGQVLFESEGTDALICCFNQLPFKREQLVRLAVRRAEVSAPAVVEAMAQAYSKGWISDQEWGAFKGVWPNLENAEEYSGLFGAFPPPRHAILHGTTPMPADFTKADTEALADSITARTLETALDLDPQSAKSLEATGRAANQLSIFVWDSILSASDREDVHARYDKWKEVYDKLVENRDFASAVLVGSALQNTAISRLLDEKRKEAETADFALLAREKNFPFLRGEQTEEKGPYIPALSLIGADMEFITQNPKGLFRANLVMPVIERVAQAKNYPLPRHVLYALEYPESMKDDTLYDLSYALKPRGS